MFAMRKMIDSAEHQKLVKRLIAARNKAGLRQEDVARILHVDQSFISKIESGFIRIDLVQIKEFARAYKTPLSLFIP